MIVVTPRAMAAIARAYRAMHDAGLSEDAEELIAAFRETPQPTTPTTPPPPPKRPRVRTEEEKAADRLRKAQARLSDKLSATSDHGGQGRTNGRTNGGQFPPSDSPNSEEKLLVLREFSAQLESSEKSVRSETRASDTSDIGRTARRTNGGHDGGQPALTLWRLIQNEWVKLVHGGKRAGDPFRSAKDFESVAKDAESRCPREPLPYATEVMRRYVAHKLSKGQTPEPRWFAADFAGWADAIAKRNGNGAAPKTPWVLEYERLDALWKAAQKRGDKAKEKELYDQIATLGKQVSHA